MKQNTAELSKDAWIGGWGGGGEMSLISPPVVAKWQDFGTLMIQERKGKRNPPAQPLWAIELCDVSVYVACDWTTATARK